MCHASKERELMFGTRSADYIRASGHNGCINRPNTWLHPNASLKCPIFSLAPRAPSIHGTKRPYRDVCYLVAFGGKAENIGSL